jgi:hypothetical protein
VIHTVVAGVAGIFQVADMALPAVAAGAVIAHPAIQAEAAVVTVRQDIREAAVLTAGRAFPVVPEVTADKAFPAAVEVIMAEAAITAAAETTTGEGMAEVMYSLDTTDAAAVTTAVACILDTAPPTTGMGTRPMRTIRGIHTVRDTLTIPVMAKVLAAPALMTSMATGFPIRTALTSRITPIRTEVNS